MSLCSRLSSHMARGRSSKSDRDRELSAEGDGPDAHTEVRNFDDPMKRSGNQLHLRHAKDQSRESPRRGKQGKAVTAGFPPGDCCQRPQRQHDAHTEPDVQQRK